jgi:hypothetical protein
MPLLPCAFSPSLAVYAIHSLPGGCSDHAAPRPALLTRRRACKIPYLYLHPSNRTLSDLFGVTPPRQRIWTFPSPKQQHSLSFPLSFPCPALAALPPSSFSTGLDLLHCPLHTIHLFPPHTIHTSTAHRSPHAARWKQPELSVPCALDTHQHSSAACHLHAAPLVNSATGLTSIIVFRTHLLGSCRPFGGAAVGSEGREDGRVGQVRAQPTTRPARRQSDPTLLPPACLPARVRCESERRGRFTHTAACLFLV